jgi:very-short-patch-repair endonuclease
MSDVGLIELAGRQFNRVSRRQLLELGYSARSIDRRLSAGRLVIVEEGVFAVAPVLAHDPWGRWMAATLTAPVTVLSHRSAAVAWGALTREPELTTVTRPGSGGPQRHGGLRVHRSTTVTADLDRCRGIPITSPPRTLVDLAATEGPATLARATREAIRLGHTDVRRIADHLGACRGRRGTRRLALTLERYAGLPIARARSGAEIRAIEVLRDAGFTLPRLNVVVSGAEADLVWPRLGLIIEIDGGPFHLDAGADARKERSWRAAGWTVLRVGAERVYDQPEALIALAHAANVARAHT